MANRLITPNVVTATEYSKLIFLEDSTISFIDSSFGYEEVNEIMFPLGTILEGNFENVKVETSGKVIGTPINRKLRNKLETLKTANSSNDNVAYCWGMTSGENRFIHADNKFLRIIDVENIGIDIFSQPGNMTAPIKKGIYQGIEINRLDIPTKVFNKEKTILINLYETKNNDLNDLNLVATSYLQGMIDDEEFNTDSLSESFADFDGVRIRTKYVAVEIIIPQEQNKIYASATVTQENSTDASNSYILTKPCGFDEWTPISSVGATRDIAVGIVGRRVKTFGKEIKFDDLPLV